MAEGRDLAEASSRRDGAAFRIAGLTPRERQVVALLVAGTVNKESPIGSASISARWKTIAPR